MQQALKEPGQRVVGARQVLRAIPMGTVREVFIARDADPFVTRPVMDACEKAKIRITEMDSMVQLGTACGIAVKASVAGLLA